MSENSFIYFPDHDREQFLIITGSNGEIVRISQSTGKVTIAEGVEVDEAAKLFWSAVETFFPCNRGEK